MIVRLVFTPRRCLVSLGSHPAVLSKIEGISLLQFYFKKYSFKKLLLDARAF